MKRFREVYRGYRQGVLFRDIDYEPVMMNEDI